MRTTLTVDDDVLRAVKERAAREHRTAGEVLSELARQSLTRSATHSARTEEARYGFRPLPHRGGVVTNELIDDIRDDEAL
ncbi:ribbon-helix-helix protein, CopG family [Microlunatus elymi]|uniref:Ribbon-helix-helix protein, CopG family n=1 Tax=Microlunatus elymi TaxID=2596828 RepID=A0A516PZ48_9ACTN|nr:ribbon-helix-helix protein, CopG family [Microlunatus elymi]QDP96261.1 ribbon-helix-helix protein, CopG family [Microlunatus elymi]